MPPFSQTIFTLLMVIATAAVQLTAQLTLYRATENLPKAHPGHFSGFHKMAFTITAVVILMCGHLAQVGIWALRYYEWGELGSLGNSIYFSLASFTTVGANELELTRTHRFVGAIESALGMLMFGWSTALLFEVTQRADDGRGTRR